MPDAVPAPLVVVLAAAPAERFAPTLRSLRAALPDAEIVVGDASDAPVTGDPAEDGGLGAAIDEVGATHLPAVAVGELLRRARPAGPGTAFSRHVLVVAAPVLVPRPFCDAAGAGLERDLRIAAVSFLTDDDAAGGDHDPQSVTDALRAQQPDPLLVGLPAPAGAVTLLSRHALSAIDGIEPPPTLTRYGQVVDLVLCANDRAFVCALDRSTFVHSPTSHAHPDPLHSPADREILLARHPHLADVLAATGRSGDAPGALARRSAAVITDGLTLAIDGRAINEQEMGTQVHTLALAAALAERADVKIVTIATNGPIPPYAAATFAKQKVRHLLLQHGDFSTLPDCDVLHRPYQPDVPLPITAWRQRARRVVVTLQDLIAYQTGSYSGTPEAWQRYRQALWTGAEQADAVVAISHDAAAQIRFECLNVEPDRLFVAPMGTDHLTGDEDGAVPAALAHHDLTTARFLFVLGADYAHKQRDLAIKAWALLRQAHPDLALVMVGAKVPAGSSRLAELAVTPAPPAPLYTLADVAGAERNWLLRHAEVVLYPTSAEGFGLVPFEAARFGTPTAQVNFGPLAEINRAPIAADTWAARSFADTVAALLDDPDARAAQVAATLAAGADHTWARTAADLVEVYRSTLGKPPRNAYSLTQVRPPHPAWRQLRRPLRLIRRPWRLIRR